MSSILFLILFTGEGYLNQHDFNEASRYYRLISATDPSYESYYGAAICALIDGELNRSVDLFESISSKKPEIYYYLGVLYYQLGFYDKSAVYFNLLREKNRNIWQANYYLGIIKLKQNKIEEAMEYFDRTPDSFDKILLVDYIENYNRLISAQQKFKDSKYHEAIDLYNEVEHFFGYKEIGLALSFTQIENYEKSLVLFDSVINNSDDRQLISRSMFEAAIGCLLLENTPKAREYLKRYLCIEPNDKARFLLGKTFSDEAKYDSAIIHFKNLPDSVDEYLFYKGRTDYFMGLWGKAEELLLWHRESFPNSIYGDKATFILASINFKRKEYNLAIDFWNELVVIYPNSIYAAAAQKGIGDAYFNIEKYEDALNVYRGVRKYSPLPNIESPTILRIHETLFYLKEYPSLIFALRRFVEENPKSRLVLKTRLRIAKILFDNKEYYRSLFEINRIIEDYPDSSLVNEAFIEKARIFQTIGNIQEVKKVFHHLLANKKNREYYSFAANELGVICFYEAKYDSALYYYNLILNDEKYREKAIFEIAKIYDILGQIKESETMIDKLISEFPSSVFLFDAYILRTKAYKNQGRYDEAINILMELIKRVGQKPEIHIEIGHLYFETEDYVNARKNYLIACEHFKQKRDDAAMALLLAGDASIAIGDKEGAREYFLQAHLIAEFPTLKDKATAKISSIGDE